MPRAVIHAATRWWIVALVAIGCHGPSEALATGSSAASTGNDEPPDAMSTGSSGVDGSTTSDGSDAATAGTSDSTGDDVGFIEMPDGGSVSYECNLIAQDCPRGLKCMPWANDGGVSWNATKCTPIADDPGGKGDPCTVEGNGVSGIDDCDLGHICLNLDERGAGSCEAFCRGSYDDPVCDPGESCAFGRNGPPLCVSGCDPFAQDCPIEGDVCYPIDDRWACAPDASGDAGAHGDPCEFINACEPGHVCVFDPGAFSSCTSRIGCCTTLCDHTDAAADALCEALDPAHRCEPWYAEGGAPLGYEEVGACLIP